MGECRMVDDAKNFIFANKIDSFFDECAQLRKLKSGPDEVYVKAHNEPEDESIKCRFKGNCYALKSNMGDCPCLLRVE